jgi:hypothetical protein
LRGSIANTSVPHQLGRSSWPAAIRSARQRGAYSRHVPLGCCPRRRLASGRRELPAGGLRALRPGRTRTCNLRIRSEPRPSGWCCREASPQVGSSPSSDQLHPERHRDNDRIANWIASVPGRAGRPQRVVTCGSSSGTTLSRTGSSGPAPRRARRLRRRCRARRPVLGLRPARSRRSRP